VTQANDVQSEAARSGAAVESGSTEESLGNQLRAAREQQGLSVEQVSEALHLDAPVITALEQDNFATLGATVYVRGHLKTYAQLLGLSPDAILSAYQSPDSEPVVAPVLRKSKNVSVQVNPVLWAGGALVIVLGLLLGVYVLLNDEPGAGPGVAVEESADTPGAVPAGPTPPVIVESTRDYPLVEEILPESPRVFIAPPVVTEAPLPVTRSEVEVKAQEESFSPVPRPAATTVRLELQFSQESWVEISDANRRLLFGLQHEGNRRELVGEPPFNLLIGNARGVTLMVNDEPYSVPAAGVRGKVARFEITDADLGQVE